MAIPNFLVQEYTTADEDLWAPAFPGTLKRQGGYLEVPEVPGLGVRLDEGRLASIERRLWDPKQAPLRQDGSVARAV